MVVASKIYYMIGSIYAARGFKLVDDFGNLVDINDQTTQVNYNLGSYYD
jgi:hypothetical protein